MGEYGVPFDGILTGDASVAPYSAAEWARIWRLQHGAGSAFPNYGVFPGSGDGSHQPLEVDATTILSSNVQVQIGSAMVDGHFYETTAAVTLAIGANASGNPRIDTVILRLDYLAQTVRLIVKQGTPAGSPVAPTMQQDATYWEIPLANVAVANGFTTLAQSTITQRQRFIHSLTAGWQSVAYPLYYSHNVSYDASSITFASGTNGKAIPFVLSANILLQEVVLRHVTNVVASYTINWGLYVQDVNDGNTAENTLRLVANGTASGATAGTQNITIPCNPTPQVLTPGSYWLVIAVPTGSGGAGIAIGRVNAGSWDLNFATYRDITGGGVANPPPQTLDLVTSTTSNNGYLGVLLRGRVFGMTSGI